PVLGPLVAGVRRARIVVPAALTADADALDWVLRHERAHVRRHDLLLGSLLQLACIGCWPVLPVWIAARRIRALMEVACDERALRGADGATRRRYGELLLALAESSPATVAMSFGSPLRGRLRALARRHRWPVALQALIAGLLGLLAIACAGQPALDEVATSDGGDAGNDSTTVASPGLAASTPRRRPLATVAADGRTPPLITIDGGGVLWLHTRRLGSLRIGEGQPLEPALREAMAETGSRTIIIERWRHSPPELTERVRAAARRAGATDEAVVDLDGRAA